MPLSLPFLYRLRIVDDCYKPVPIVPNVKDDVALCGIGILERSADLIKIVPTNRLDDGGPSFDFVRCIWVGFHRLSQVLPRNDMHSVKILHNLLSCQVRDRLKYSRAILHDEVV